MIFVGNNIRDVSQPLKKVSLKYLSDAIRNPRPEIAARIRQLRVVRQISPEQYKLLKRDLPYFACAVFNPPFRKTENFAYTEYFVIDVDHLASKGMNQTGLRKRLSADSRVLLLFSSPGNDGLKVMMRLKERCFDAAVYKVFYQLFVQEFSNQYGLQQVVDSRTCDVARACFISVDSEAFFNPECDSVDLKAYINVESDVHFALNLKRETDKSLRHTAAESEQQDPAKEKDPTKEIMARIRQRLNPESRRCKEKTNVYVPVELENIVPGLTSHMQGQGIEIVDIRSIQYGKKMRFKLGTKQAEINIFYGKHGFSVVQSPRIGTDMEMNQLMAEVVEAYIVEKA